MAKKLYVGSIPYDTTDAQLEELFSQAGKVESATAITDKYSGRGKGFGFVEMETEEGAKNAIQTLNGHDLNGRTIVVNEARPKEDRNNSSSSGGRRNYSSPRRW